MKKQKKESVIMSIRVHTDIYEKYVKACKTNGWTKSRKLLDKIDEIINIKN
jgi:hypothetical protein